MQIVPESNSISEGSYIKITSGRNKGSNGTITEISKRSSGTVIKVLLPSNEVDIISLQIVRVWDDEVQLQMKLTWMRPHIRTRIISKSFKNGRYYNEKCIIQDVSIGNTTVRLDSGHVIDGNLNLIQGITERHLETYIPTSGKSVMIVEHADKSLVGQLAKVMDRDQKNDKAMVQYDLSYDFEVCLILNLDIIFRPNFGIR